MAGQPDIIPFGAGQGGTLTRTSAGECVGGWGEYIQVGTCQAAHRVLAVTPTEYDAAVRETPELCPLLLDGDHRSGSQLHLLGQQSSVSSLCM